MHVFIHSYLCVSCLNLAADSDSEVMVLVLGSGTGTGRSISFVCIVL